MSKIYEIISQRPETIEYKDIKPGEFFIIQLPGGAQVLRLKLRDGEYFSFDNPNGFRNFSSIDKGAKFVRAALVEPIKVKIV